MYMYMYLYTVHVHMYSTCTVMSLMYTVINMYMNTINYSGLFLGVQSS